jgi:hypothetical protein
MIKRTNKNLWAEGAEIQTKGIENLFNDSWAWWCIPAILASCEVEIGRIEVQGQPGQKVSKIPSQQTSQLLCYVPMIPSM